MGEPLRPFKGLVPYIVSGPLARSTTLLSVLDALVHVLVWVAVWALEIYTFVRVYDIEDKFVSALPAPPHGGSPLRLFTVVQVGSIVTLALATVAVVLCVATHLLTEGIQDGKLPPSLTSCITGGIKASALFTFMLLLSSLFVFLMTAPTPLVPKLVHEEDGYLEMVMALLFLKVFGTSISLNNLRFAVSADQEPLAFVDAQ